MIRRIIGKAILYGGAYYLIVMNGMSRGFSPFDIYAAGTNDFLVYFLLGIITWFMFDVIRKIVKLVTKPVGLFTFGFLGIAINIGSIYLISYSLDVLDIGIMMKLGSPLEIALFSGILWLIDLVF